MMIATRGCNGYVSSSISLNFCIITYTKAVANADAISADIKKGLLVGGISAGGNLTAGITQRARGDPALQGKITGQILIVPLVIVPNVYPEQYVFILRR
jgi:acetyl esterase/lipase